MKVVYLIPGGAYQSDLQSDTLFGMICWAIRQVFSEEELVDLLDRFAAGDPPFLLSSAFPFVEQGGVRQLLLPHPKLTPAETAARLTKEEAARRKQYKKVRWIPAEHFSAFLQGEYTEDDYYESGAWEKIELPEMHRTERLRSRIDRLSGRTDGSGTLFGAPEQRIGRGGLYFLLKGDEAARVESCLEFLVDFGWGGKNSIGQNLFRVEVEEQEAFTEVGDPDRFVTLSLYHPRPEELGHFQQGEPWYSLTVRKGKVGGHFLRVPDFWKRSLMMFEPGSSFPVIPGRAVYGGNPVVKGREDGLDFDVQQMGYAFTAGMKSAGRT